MNVKFYVGRVSVVQYKMKKSILLSSLLYCFFVRSGSLFQKILFNDFLFSEFILLSLLSTTYWMAIVREEAKFLQLGTIGLVKLFMKIFHREFSIAAKRCFKLLRYLVLVKKWRKVYNINFDIKKNLWNKVALTHTYTR